MAGEANHNGEPIIRLVDVYKSFPKLDVLTGVSLALRPGETTVVIGESGAGKSVLLKHITGLLQPDRGEVYFHDRRIDTMGERDLVDVRKRFGFLFQLSALFDSLTVAQNVAFPLNEHTRKSKAEVEQIVAEKLAMVGLDGLQNKRVPELSGGQKKRVALARAIALDPEVILYDEPTTGLDPPRSDVINRLIVRLRTQLGATSVVVTHDMASAFTVADRIIMLYQGRFIFDGSPQAARTCADARVRRFIEGKASKDDLEGLNDLPKGTP